MQRFHFALISDIKRVDRLKQAFSDLEMVFSEVVFLVKSRSLQDLRKT
jgi:hypothetical protein